MKNLRNLVCSSYRNRTAQPYRKRSGLAHKSKFTQNIPLISESNTLLNGYQFDTYHTFDTMTSSLGLYLRAVTGLSDGVRISERLNLPRKRLRGFEAGKIGPVDANDHVGGNYVAAINFDAQLPNLLPDAYNADLGFFLDFGNVWGVDYDSSIDDSNKIRSSTGVNVNWLSPLGPVSFTLATNLAKATTDQTQSFNFSLGTQF